MGASAHAPKSGLLTEKQSGVAVIRSPMAFSPCCFLAVDHEQRTVVLSVRGTACAGDTLTDCCADPVPFLGGHAHAGIVAATWQLVAAFVPRLAAALVSEALAACASWCPSC